MSENLNPTVQAVQESVVNLLELVEQAARGQSVKQVEDLRDEAQKTVLMLIAAIVLADNRYTTGEEAFVNLLVDWSKKPGGAVRYLNEYAERWKIASMQLPRFFQTGIDHDTRHHTSLAQSMVRELQLIGNNICVSDGHYEAIEHEVVRNYIIFLEEYLIAWRAQYAASAKEPATGWTIV